MGLCANVLYPEDKLSIEIFSGCFEKLKSTKSGSKCKIKVDLRKSVSPLIYRKFK